MVSSGNVSGDSSSVEQISSNYIAKIEGLSGTWQGKSHDSLSSQSSSFSSEMKNVSTQLTSFAKAVDLYKKYEEAKNKQKEYYSKACSATDQAVAGQYRATANDAERQANDYSGQIKSALSEASSFKMSNVSNIQPLTTNGAASQQTTTGHTSINGVGGTFVADKSKGLYGHFTADDGRVFDVYRQSQIKGWARDCNRAAAASIASGYQSNGWDAVKIAQDSPGGLGYKQDVTSNYFANFGLNANVNHVGGKYDNIKNDIVTNVSNGNYVMFDLSKPNVRGQSGQRWTATRHWLSVLDIKKTGDGDNDYAIFVSDSGHKGSTKDYGYGTGWYSLDEFSGQSIENFTTISKA